MVSFKIGDKARYKDEGEHGDVFTVLQVYGDTHVGLSLREFDDIEQDFQTHNDELVKVHITAK